MSELDLTNIARVSIATPASGVMAMFVDTLDKCAKQKDENGVTKSFVNPWFSVKDYGATGDGSTDDTTAIQACMTAAASGGTVFFPAGTYIVTATIVLPANNCTIKGENRGKSVISAKTTFIAGDILQCQSGGDSINIRDLFVTSQSATARTIGASINVNGCHDVIINSVNIYYPYIGIQISGGGTKTYIFDYDIKVPTALTTSANSAGIFINNGGTGDTYIGRGNIESASGAGKAQYGIRIQTTGYTQMFEVAATAFDVGLAINPSNANETAINIFAAQCLFDTCATNGAAFTTTLSTNKIRQARFTDCWFSGTSAGSGMLFTVTAGVQDDISFQGCRFLSNFTHGLTMAGAGIAGLTNLSVVGCDIAGNSTTGAGTAHGINIIAGCGKFSVIGNRICSMDTFGTNQGYAVNIAAGAYTSYIVIDNDFSGNTTGGVNDLGTLTGQGQKIVENNIGGLIEGLLSSSVAAVTVIANANTIVAGGLNVCPIPANSIKIGDSFRFSVDGSFTGTATATAIQIHLGTAGTVADAVILTSSVTGAVGTTQGRIVGEFTFRTIGATGTVNGATLLTQLGVVGLGNAAVLPVVCTTTTAPNTTTTNYLTISLLTAASGSSGTANVGLIEKL